ncbi:MAG TPA: 2-amino-4-hydroxy-6-hydroxymethyldihydropteridine diphosphokinase [Terracidiphilus sp.]|nr:2-amino-4-hydroxy-6-hydroxymethyldihydropteridine diphosphokinase [Terracidiphilus sp.]
MAYIGMGANLESWAGLPASTLAAAVERLGLLGQVVRRSSLYLTEPVGYADQPRFTNAVVALETAHAPAALLHELLTIEKEFGRDRAASFANGPRSLDLDILLLGDLCVSMADLVLPHPRLAGRAFVLVPLNEIAPRLRVPQANASVAELLDRLHKNKPEDIDAVVPMESSVWSAGGSAGSDAAR